MGFTHLHCHTQYSILDGLNRIKDYVKRVKELNMTSCAITDHGNMFGVIEFYKECKKLGINPIIGCEVYVARKSRYDREKVDNNIYDHLVLLAKDNIGYHNLIKIVSIGYLEGFYYKPRIDIDVLNTYHEGLIALSGCLGGKVAKYLCSHEYDKAKETALEYNKIFGKDNYYLELQDHGIREQKIVNQGLLKIHNETCIPLVATNDSHYTYKEDALYHDILLCINTNSKVSDEDRFRFHTDEFYIKSEEEMRSIFPYALSAIDNTEIIASRCNVDISFGELKLPHFEVEKGYDNFSYLCMLCEKGLIERYDKKTIFKDKKIEDKDKKIEDKKTEDKYKKTEDKDKENDNYIKSLKKRLSYELSIIKEMGYVDYFLIVWDFINYARKNNIYVGPGRGSAAGSIVSYVLHITNIDPIKYNLLFERFLNPERVSMPDIDIDFAPERRKDVLNYVVNKYGKECVTQIITFGLLKPRSAIRDVVRVLNMPYSFGDNIVKDIPYDNNITIEKALKENPILKKRYDTEEDFRKVIDISKKIEGIPRNTGIHAAGVVISKKPIDNYIPLARGVDGSIITQFEKTTVEELGLLKMDFLSLRNLTVIENTVNKVREEIDKSFSIDKIDYEDKKVYDLIKKGHTDGVFQLESIGMKKFMKELKPSSLEDIIAGISLYRPGPMDFIPMYIEGKHNPSKVKYDTNLLEPILKNTYGCIVYQEQVMEIVRNLAGYSLGRSDLVRRAMSKKNIEAMEKERQIFIYGDKKSHVKGCINNGISEKIANKIYDEMIDFAKYAFNKSHAASYAYLSYMTAYLKTYYKEYFMSSLLTSVMDDNKKIAKYILSLKEIKIDILMPNINKSFSYFNVENGNIRYGLSAIKNMGNNLSNLISDEREKRGKYTSLNDFINRMGKNINKKAIESLIKAGALDDLKGNRKQKMLNFPKILDVFKSKKDMISGQLSIFDLGILKEDDSTYRSFLDVEDFTPDDKLLFEKEVMGLYLSSHPLKEYKTYIEENVTAYSSDFDMDSDDYVEENNNTKMIDKEEKIIAGIIISKKVVFTKKGNKPMAIITIEDLLGEIEVVIYNREYLRYSSMIYENNKVFIKGRVNYRENSINLTLSSIVSFSDIKNIIWIRLNDKMEYKKQKKYLDSIETVSEGMDEIIIYLTKEKQIKSLGNRYFIASNMGKMNELYKMFGKNNIVIKKKKIAFNG